MSVTDRRAALQSTALYTGVAVLATVVVYMSIGPESRDDSHWWRGVLAALGIVFTLAWAGLHVAAPHVKRIGADVLRSVMIVTVVFGWFNYYQFDKKVFDGLGDYTDITYYYVNSKYLGELGYFGLYPAMILADAEGPKRHSAAVKHYRDLRDYEEKPVEVALQHGRQIKAESFTPERWEEFAHDADYFLSRKSTRSMTGNFYVDHGYNPPPTWSVPGKFLADLAPAENVKSIALVDVGIVAGMFAVVAWAFGIDAMLFAMLFFVTTFSGRWPILGEALLRFDWVSALVVSMCMLKKEKWALAGGFLAYAALNRVFPAIFFFGWGIVFLIDTYRHRKLLTKHLHFIAGAGAVSVFLIGMALVQFGPQTFKDSTRNLLMHNKSYSSHRVGLGDLALFRGEKTRAEMNRTTYEHGPGGRPTRGIQAKEYILRDNQLGLRLAALLALGFLSFYAWRSKRDAWELLPLAALPFFLATNPQINYWNLRLVLFVWHGYQLARGTDRRALHVMGLMLLFACEVATQHAHLMEVPDPGNPARMLRAERYYVTSTTSLWMGIYFTALCAALGWEAFNGSPPEPTETDDPALAAAAG